LVYILLLITTTQSSSLSLFRVNRHWLKKVIIHVFLYSFRQSPVSFPCVCRKWVFLS
jgi:hypothetical protein